MIKLSANYIEELLYTGLYTPGLCVAVDCNEFDEYAGVEPDADKYSCPCCERPTFYGLEQALRLGLVGVS